MTKITIKNVSRQFGATRAVDGVSLTIESGELFFLLGPSGCGKTTLLRMLAGFVTPEEGHIAFDDQVMTDVPPRLRNTGMVFQNYALWPHRTVAGNVAYGLEVRGLSRAEIKKKVDAALALVRLTGLADRRPGQLSGGQQQRVALARALVIQPRVLLLDEPLSNLDARLRLEMREEIHRIHRETGLTMVYVTHDQKEALSLASRIAVMRAGKIEQVGDPVGVYTRPCSRFVAEFMGDGNFITGRVVEARADGSYLVESPLGLWRGLANAGSLAAGDAVTCMVRPEAITVVDRPGSENSFTAEVERLAFLGEVLYVHLRAGKLKLLALGLQGTLRDWRQGEPVHCAVSVEQVVLLES